MEKYKKSYTTIISLKYQLRYGVKNLNYMIYRILYHIQSYFEYIIEKHGEKTENPSISIYVNKIENSITFKIKTGYYLERLAPGTIKLLGSNKSKITKDKNGDNVPYLEITEVVLVYFNILDNDYQQDSRVLYAFIPNKSFG